MINISRYIFLVVLMCASAHVLSGQTMNWLTWEEAVVKTEKEPRKILVDIVTEWCGWCKKMDQTTFTDATLVEFLNENYYSVKFDAQSKEPIVYKNKTYRLENSIWKGGYHELTAEITKNQLKKLPTIVFLDENINLLQAIPGYKNAWEMELMAAYFEGNFHKSTPWKTFVSLYKSKKENPKGLNHDSSILNSTRLVSQKKN